jgi:hypothetical protein
MNRLLLSADIIDTKATVEEILYYYFPSLPITLNLSGEFFKNKPTAGALAAGEMFY